MLPAQDQPARRLRAGDVPSGRSTNMLSPCLEPSFVSSLSAGVIVESKARAQVNPVRASPTPGAKGSSSRP